MNKHKTNHDGKTNAKRNPLSLDCDYVHFCHVCVCKWAASSERKKKVPSNMNKHEQNAQIQLILRMRKLSAGPLLSIHTFCGIKSVRGQWMTWSNCTDAQADLGLSCPHRPARFRMAQSKCTRSNSSLANCMFLNSLCICTVRWEHAQVVCADVFWKGNLLNFE